MKGSDFGGAYDLSYDSLIPKEKKGTTPPKLHEPRAFRQESDPDSDDNKSAGSAASFSDLVLSQYELLKMDINGKDLSESKESSTKERPLKAVVVHKSPR